MATSATHAPQHVLNDEEKELLLHRYSDLEFVDDVTELSCKRCGRVLIHHYVANCGHLFCRNCQRILSNGTGWKCRECKEYITDIVEQRDEVEERVFGLMVHCLNHKYGCEEIMTLRQIPTHINSCEDTREASLPRLLYADTYNLEAAVDRIREMSGRVSVLTESVGKLKETQDQLIEKLKETEVKRNEQEWKINTSNTDFKLETTRLQSQMEETTSHHDMEIERMREQFLQYQTAIEMRNRQEEDNRIKDAERIKTLEKKIMELSEKLTKSNLEAEERYNEKIREMEDKVTRFKKKSDDMVCRSHKRQDFQTELDEILPEKTHSVYEVDVYMSQNAQTKFQDDIMAPDNNILLLGEGGIGKSLFINSFAKYIYHDRLSDALSALPTQCIIPMTVRLTDKNYQGNQIHFGMDHDTKADGRLETASCTTYLFNFGNFRVRLIDSPGIGRPGQVTDNNTVIESILNFMSRCEFKVNVLVIVAKSSQSHFNREFEEFVKMLLSHVDNVLFLLTHSGDTDYRAGEVVQPLLRVSANIKLSKENVFCFENKGFEYMLMKQSGHGEDIEFAESYHDAWKRSAGECCRLIQHLTHNTNSTPGISAALIQHLMATTEAERYLGNCLAFLDKHLYIISKNQTELPYVKDELTLFRSHDRLKQKEVYRCLSKSCSKLKQSPTKSNGNKSVGMCSSGIKYSWLLFTSLCLECGYQYKDHEKINIPEAIEQCKQKIHEIESTNNELKIIQMITANFGAISKAMMVPSTDRKNDLGQGTSAGVVDNTDDGDHKENTVTLANVLQLKEELLDLKIYGPQLKERFSKCGSKAKEANNHSYIIEVDHNRLTKGLQDLKFTLKCKNKLKIRI